MSGSTPFTAAIGVDDEIANSGSVVFQVWADGIKLYDAGDVTGATATNRSTSVTGKNELRLLVTVGGNGNSTTTTATGPTPSSTCG